MGCDDPRDNRAARRPIRTQLSVDRACIMLSTHQHSTGPQSHHQTMHMLQQGAGESHSNTQHLLERARKHYPPNKTEPYPQSLTHSCMASSISWPAAACSSGMGTANRTPLWRPRDRALAERREQEQIHIHIRSRRDTFRALSQRARCSSSSDDRPTCTSPSITATVAGVAPSALTTASTCLAVLHYNINGTRIREIDVSCLNMTADVAPVGYAVCREVLGCFHIVVDLN
ncbi:hypothetical protein EYF80_018056 [Liparis tanakae]|uniref:Uncharacterized protein n=1 Tax=Liparis tanakae TaxID=230148 RepID=A0A4Z2I2L4_9TELE|nr:hypothetical protein EYF80_018056 [Liparis tanakae]